MKKQIREQLIQRRKNLSKDEVLEKSKKIQSKLFQMDEHRQANYVLFYVSYDNEVFTHDMIKECMSNKHVVVPFTDKENRQLILSELKNWDDLTLGAYNILEPKKDKIKEIPIEKIDLIIIPGVGFDINGCRIGHGIGYYDGLLKNSTNALHIGLAFECQIVDRIPTEKHDIPVDMIITEERIIECLDA